MILRKKVHSEPNRFREVRPSFRGAVAIGYSAASDDAPRIEAIGAYFSADEIVSIARQYGVPVVENSPIVDALNQCDIGESIPAELFRAVAVVFKRLGISG